MTANWLAVLPKLVDEMLQENLFEKPESDDCGKFVLFYLIIFFFKF